MANPKVAQLHAWLAEHESELLDDYRTLLPSLLSRLTLCPAHLSDKPTATPWIGVGQSCIGRHGHQGFGRLLRYAEFGSGEKMIMSLGHLDVVPVGTGGNTNPLEPRSRTVMLRPRRLR